MSSKHRMRMSSSAESVRGWSMDLRILVTRTMRQHISVGCSSLSWWLQQTNMKCVLCLQLGGDEESHNFGQKSQSQLRGWCFSGHLVSLLPSSTTQQMGIVPQSAKMKAIQGQKNTVMGKPFNPAYYHWFSAAYQHVYVYNLRILVNVSTLHYSA